MSQSVVAGVPPREISLLLRIEGAAVATLAIWAYAVLGGNWWVFALLILAPDLSMLAALWGLGAGVRAYNLAHTYSVPLAIGVAGHIAGAGIVPLLALVWIAHIGLDRTLGYGLKYPDAHEHTHLGLIGKTRKAARNAQPG